MWGVAEMLRSRLFPRAVVLVLVAAGVAACSSDSFQRQSVRFARPTRRDRFDPESADRARPVAAFSAGDSRDFRRNGRDAGLAGDDWHWANDAMKGEGAFGLN